mgnify:CR=1 FL=1|eukprot:scaffold11728_cov32-Tisochrysis_lutea.AAC.1
MHLLLRYVLEHHVYVVVKAAQRAHKLLVATHHNPYPRANALINKLCRVKGIGALMEARAIVYVARRGNGTRAIRAAPSCERQSSPASSGREGILTEWQDLRHRAATHAAAAASELGG